MNGAGEGEHEPAGRAALRSLRRVWTISLWEAKRTGVSFNKKTLVLLLVMGLAMAVLTPALNERGLDFDRGLYRAHVPADSPLYAAVASAPVFRLVTLEGDPVAAIDAGLVDLVVRGDRVYTSDTDKGAAATAALKQAAKDHTFRTLLAEEDQSAAFPVRVELVYTEQSRPGTAPSLTPGGGASGGDAEGGSGDGTSEGGASGGSTTGGSAASGGNAPEKPPSGSGFSLLPPERSVNTPETLSPPFPFRSLILAYLFLIPLNFVVQVYAGSAIGERLGRKGEGLLASPARPWEIIVGKAAPFFLLMMLVCAGIAYTIGAGWLSLVAVAPLALVFLAFEFVAAMFARSFRELTFLTVFTSVLLTIYAFLPAVFTDVHPVSLVSPISLVILDMRDAPVTLGEILYSTLPLTLFSIVLFILGAALYREEDMFHQKRVVAKALDSLARQVRGLRSAFTLQLLLIPCVFVLELLLIAFLFASPANVGTLGVLVAVALVEETFKGLPAYAAFRHGSARAVSGEKAVARQGGILKTVPLGRALAFGALAGAGFFVAEKGFLLASLAGLFDVPAGAAVLGAAGGNLALTGAGIGMVLLLLLSPLLLHIVTATISATGAKYGRNEFIMSFTLAVAIHTLYNFTVVRIFGGLG